MKATIKMIKKEHELAAIAQAVKASILAALAGGTDVAHAVSASVARELATLVGTSGNTAARVTVITGTVASAAIDGVLQSRCELAPATQGLLVTILRGTRLIGSEVLAGITRTGRIAIRAVAESEADLDAAATG